MIATATPRNARRPHAHHPLDVLAGPVYAATAVLLAVSFVLSIGSSVGPRTASRTDGLQPAPIVIPNPAPAP